MPIFKLPKPKKNSSKDSVETAPVGLDDYYTRSVYLPADNKVLGAVEVGETATITLKGKVVTKVQRSEGPEKSEFTLEITSVAVETMNEFEKLSVDD